jgi:hypothetical protein
MAPPVDRNRVQPPPRSSTRAAKGPTPHGHHAALPRSFRALLGTTPPRGLGLEREPRATPRVGQLRGEDGAPSPASAEALSRAFARPERALEPPETGTKVRTPSPTPVTLEAHSVEAFHVLAEARALRLKVGGRAGQAAVEVEVRECDGELALSVETEDGDSKRADAWARAIAASLSRRGLRGEVAAR